MTYEEMSDEARWSLAGQVMAWAMAGEITLAIVTITRTAVPVPAMAAVATALAILSMVVAARTRMPRAVKASLIAALCVALLTLAAVHDPFRLRAVDRQVAAAIEGRNRPADLPPQEVRQPSAPMATVQVTLRGKGDTAAATFADELADRIAADGAAANDDYRIDGLIDISSAPSGDSYRLTWSLSGATRTLWCGRIVASGPSRAAALDSFSSRIVAALRRVRAGAGDCA